ncbi:MAG: hypothetical protein ACYS22_04655 [Planctomycetota bacterium]
MRKQTLLAFGFLTLAFGLTACPHAQRRQTEDPHTHSISTDESEQKTSNSPHSHGISTDD